MAKKSTKTVEPMITHSEPLVEDAPFVDDVPVVEEAPVEVPVEEVPVEVPVEEAGSSESPVVEKPADVEDVPDTGKLPSVTFILITDEKVLAEVLANSEPMTAAQCGYRTLRENLIITKEWPESAPTWDELTPLAQSLYNESADYVTAGNEPRSQFEQIIAGYLAHPTVEVNEQ